MERLFNPGELFGEQAFADVTIKYSGRELRAHKVILSMRSKYFERAFAVDSGFKVSFPPGKRKRISLMAF